MSAPGYGLVGKESRVLRFDARVTLHLARPLEEAQKLFALTPRESEELQEADALHFYAGVGFNSPAEIGATPRREVMAASRVPQKAQDVAHGRNQYIGEHAKRTRSLPLLAIQLGLHSDGSPWLRNNTRQLPVPVLA